MKLAITAYKNGQFSSKTAAAKAFDVPPCGVVRHNGAFHNDLALLVTRNTSFIMTII
ncbi:hypothetical protein BDW75DRAFT_246646 [Aspergillus navahoensis]